MANLPGYLKPLANGRLALVERNLGLADAIAAMERQRMPTRIQTEDIVQVARLALCQQACRFDKRLADQAFRYYAFPRVRGEIREMNRRRAWRDGQFETLEFDARTEDGDTEGMLRLRQLSECVAELVECLPVRLRLVIRLYYFGGHTLERVGMMLKPRRQAGRVCQLLHEALAILRVEAGRRGIGPEVLR